MKTALILGAGGMLGHRVLSELGGSLEVVGTARRPVPELSRFKIERGDLRDPRFVEQVLERVKPDFVVNCAGVIKQRVSETPFTDVCLLNSWLPHALGSWCQDHSARLIHVSSDCVFQGDRRGPPYRESDLPDATDLYGYSKASGEVTRLPSAVTLRTSIIGQETGESRFGLLAWFLGQAEGATVRGFRNHWWSGVTTLELAGLIHRLISLPKPISGLFQVASEPINKFELLKLMARCFKKSVQVDAFDAPEAVYRVLDGSQLQQTIGYSPKTLTHQLKDLCLLARTS